MSKAVAKIAYAPTLFLFMGGRISVLAPSGFSDNLGWSVPFIFIPHADFHFLDPAAERVFWFGRKNICGYHLHDSICLLEEMMLQSSSHIPPTWKWVNQSGWLLLFWLLRGPSYFRVLNSWYRGLIKNISNDIKIFLSDSSVFKQGPACGLMFWVGNQFYILR